MGNSSGTNARKDSDVIAAIVDEKNTWHETLSGVKRPDMNLINDMLFNSHQRLQRYMQQIHPASVEIATDRDKRTVELEEKVQKLQTENDALRESIRRDSSKPIATSDQVPGRKESSSRPISTSDQVLGRKDSSSRPISTSDQVPGRKKENPVDMGMLIFDLSDKNRPTKLGELYTEIYDLEWTDAYEALTKSGYRDTEAIETMLKTLKVCFEFCQSKTDQLLESTVKAVVNAICQEVHEQMKDQKNFHQTLAVMSKQDNRSDAGVLNQIFFKTLSLQSRWKSKLEEVTDRKHELLCTIYQPQSFEEELKRSRKQMSQLLIPVLQNVSFDQL